MEINYQGYFEHYGNHYYLTCETCGFYLTQCFKSLLGLLAKWDVTKKLLVPNDVIYFSII